MGELDYWLSLISLLELFWMWILIYFLLLFAFFFFFLLKALWYNEKQKWGHSYHSYCFTWYCFPRPLLGMNEIVSWASLVGQWWRIHLPMQEMWVQLLGWEDPLEKERECNPLQYSCLVNLMDRGAWWTTVHRVAKSQTWLSNWTCTTGSYLTARNRKSNSIFLSSNS